MLRQFGVRHIVACPGSRNAPILHNLHAAHYSLHAVTDERSAGFVAIGLMLSLHQPVAVCVTSGSALLGTIPAAAEAYYRRLPLLVISADRPPCRIDQWEGQTIHQNHALLPYAPTFELPENANGEAEERDMASLTEKALHTLESHGGQPVHLNLPLEEPLFHFSTISLPDIRARHTADHSPALSPANDCLPAVMASVGKAQFPLLVIGQYEGEPMKIVEKLDREGKMLVLPEVISRQKGSQRMAVLDVLLSRDPSCRKNLQPDLVVHMGGNAVGKQLRQHLRQCPPFMQVIRIENGPFSPDTFDHPHTVVHSGQIEEWLQRFDKMLAPNPHVIRWRDALIQVADRLPTFEARELTDIRAMMSFSHGLPHTFSALHLANSSAVRHAAFFMDAGNIPVCCNRGTNGIEGSMSTAIGHALAAPGKVALVIGDLSFFYDLNALSITPLPHNLLILLLNNGGGQIFQRLPGLERSPARDIYVSAGHTHSARWIAKAFGCQYRAIRDETELEEGMQAFLDNQEGPALLEVFTDNNRNEQERRHLEQWIQETFLWHKPY